MSLHGTKSTETKDVDMNDNLTHVTKEALQALKDKLPKPPAKDALQVTPKDNLKHVKPEALDALTKKLHREPRKHTIAEINNEKTRPFATFQQNITEGSVQVLAKKKVDVANKAEEKKTEVVSPDVVKVNYSAKYAQEGSELSLEDFLSKLTFKDTSEEDYHKTLAVRAKTPHLKTGLSEETFVQELERLALKEKPPVVEVKEELKKSSGFLGISFSMATPVKPKSAYELKCEQRETVEKQLDPRVKAKQDYATSHQMEPDFQKRMERRDKALKDEFVAIDQQYSGWLPGSTRQGEIVKAKVTLTPMLQAHAERAKTLYSVVQEQARSKEWHDSEQYQQYQGKKALKV